MVSSVAEHYANHLAPICSWMVGDFDTACTSVDHFYSDIQLPNGNSRITPNLRFNHRFHSLPLFRCIYHVLSLNTLPHPLNKLNIKIGELPINAVAADLMQFSDHLGSESASLIACMGDTLTHLPSLDAVKHLIDDSAHKVTSDGLLTVSFRDYSIQKLVGAQRFIPIRSDNCRIHTCFLDYCADTIIVHDIVHTLVDSEWQTSVSASPKIRLSPDVFISIVEANGLSLIYKKNIRGKLYFAFKRSDLATSES